MDERTSEEIWDSLEINHRYEICMKVNSELPVKSLGWDAKTLKRWDLWNKIGRAIFLAKSDYVFPKKT